MNITWNYKALQVCRVCLFKYRVKCDFPLRTYCRNVFKICPEFNSKQLSLIMRTNNSHLPRRYSTNLNILLNKNETVINKYLNTVMEKYSSNADLANILGTSPHSKKIHDLLQLLYSRSSLCDSLKSLEELESGDLKDKELQSLAENEREDYKEQLRQLDKNLIMQLIPEEPYDILDDLLIEIKHGVGGQEAMLFAKDLFEMYLKYFVYKGWKYEIAELNISDIGGLRTSSILVYGTDAYKYMCYEGGVHRVQRIPSTEKGGRVHTSTVAVAVLPQPSEIDVVINDKDLKIETKRASGAGGQHVNTTDSAVRITHIPTGTVVECQEDRSQLKNRTIALQRLRTTIYQVQINEQLSKIRTKRKLQVGTSARSEKIRTYNFNQDRITDHRIGLSLYSMESFLEGTELLDKMLLALQEESHSERLSEFISKLEIS